MRAQEYADLLGGCEQDADTIGADAGPRPHAPEQRATLDAVRASDGGANDFFDVGAADLRATAGLEADDASSRKRTRSTPAPTDQPAGAALLEAVLYQL